jgi:MFS transporter, ACS family, D-galactonate transporter
MDAAQQACAARRFARQGDWLRRYSATAIFLGHFPRTFGSNYLLYFMVTWLPFYLVHERHLSMQNMVRTASVYYLVDAVSAITTGWVSDFWIRKGCTPTLVRKTVMAIGFATSAVAVTACAMVASAAGPQIYLPCLMAVGIGSGMAGSGVFAFTQTLAGPHAAGRWAGLQNGFANLAGVIAPALTGFALDRTDSFAAPFVITAGVLIAGGLSWVFVVGRVEQVSWATKDEVLMPAATA